MLPLHPKIVHFPVALLITSAFFGILALIFKKRRELFKEVLFWNLLLGVAGAILAIITGLSQEDTLVHNEAIHELMETHETLGFIFSGLFAVLLVWMIFRKSKMKTGELVGFVVILIVSAGLLTYSAHLGGKMVYGEGAGVVPMKPILEREGYHHHHDNGVFEHHNEPAADTLEKFHHSHNGEHLPDEH
jgi:uncharacterized membrane protein